MGQAKLRKAAVLSGKRWLADHPLPKDLIARAVREPRLQSDRFTATCVYQAEVGQRILRARYGLECILQVGDFMRPVGEGLHHTYTRDDGRIDVRTGACHAWLYCRTSDEIIDFAAWETPLSFERAGNIWPAAKPDYLWESPRALRDQGYIVKPDGNATMTVMREFAGGRDAAFLSTYTAQALAILDA